MSKRIALCFFVDALGWETAQKYGCFRPVAPHAYRQRTVLGYSCAAQPTILTGAMPSTHEHWGMFYLSERSELSPLRHLRWLPGGVSHHPRFRNALLNVHRRMSGFTGYYNFYRIPYELFARFDLVEKRDLYAPGAFDADVSSIFDILAERGVPYRSWSWKTPLEQSARELREVLLTDPEIRFAMLYTPVFDAFLHTHIGDEGATRETLAHIEQTVADLVAVARDRYSEVDVVVFSDHGMAPVVETFDLVDYLTRRGLAGGRRLTAFYDSTMARFWPSSDAEGTAIEDALRESGHGTVLTREYLVDEGVYFADGRFGRIIFLMNPGTLILPSHMGVRAPRGMHGYSPDDEDSYAVLMSSDPVSPEPTHIRDSHRVMVSLLERE